jgi:hypothetical protein
MGLLRYLQTAAHERHVSISLGVINMKALCFSVYGDDPLYCVGAVKNAETASIFYPDWKCLIWYDKSVPNHYIEKLQKLSNVELIDASDMNMPGRYWRFNCFQRKDVEVFCVRDTDCRFSKREIEAVEAWLKSGKSLHTMRDHPHHNYHVMAGMWGFRNDLASWDIESHLKPWLEAHKIVDKIDDTNFLVQLYFDFANDVLVHDDWRRCPNSVTFPNPRPSPSFVGQTFFADESTTDHWKLLF